MRIGQIVYLHNPARKPGISHKFTPVWQGPYQIQGRVGELDYKIADVQGKESIVHVNRLKVARDPSIWKPKAKAGRTLRRRQRSPRWGRQLRFL